MDDANIVGGYPVPRGECPSFAVVNGTIVCGATLIYADVLASAAHCHAAFAQENAVVMSIGGTRLDGSDAIERIPIDGVLIHARYRQVVLNDILLIFLSRPRSNVVVGGLELQTLCKCATRQCDRDGHWTRPDDPRLWFAFRVSAASQLDGGQCRKRRCRRVRAAAQFCPVGYRQFACHWLCIQCHYQPSVRIPIGVSGRLGWSAVVSNTTTSVSSIDSKSYHRHERQALVRFRETGFTTTLGGHYKLCIATTVRRSIATQ
jgi:Trypsin